MHRVAELSLHVSLYDGRKFHVSLVEDVWAGPTRQRTTLRRETARGRAELEDLVVQVLHELEDRAVDAQHVRAVS